VDWLAPILQHHLPALRGLRMSGYTQTMSGDSHLPIEGHFTNLTHLHAAAKVFRMRLVDILRGCSRLVACWLYLHRDRDGHNGEQDDTMCQPFTMPYLRTLWMSVIEGKYWRDVFAHATFPVLGKLTLSGPM